MNENNSMAYTQNDDATNDSLQNHSVYAQDNPSSTPESGTTTTQDILSSAPESGAATAQDDIPSSAAEDSTPASQSDPVCLQKENTSSEPLQDNVTYPQHNTIHDSYPQNDAAYTQNITAPTTPAYAQNNAAQSNPAYTQNNTAQNNPTAYTQNSAAQYNPAYAQDNRMQNTPAYAQNNTMQSTPAYAQNNTAQGNPTAAMTYNNTPLLQLNDLCKRYPGMGTYMSVFHMNLIIPRGRIIGLLGPNGCGKTTLIKMINGLLAPTCGNVLINGMEPGPATKKIISYLPERTYLDNSMKVSQMVSYFADFYEDFSTEKAYGMLGALGISSDARLKTLSKGTKEKVQLILVMSRQADLYILDEPIAGVDPAARDYILRTIITNYNPGSTIILSTHLISDIENILDDVIFMKNGSLMLYTSVDSIRSQMGKSVDTYFREVYAC